ncbi:MAG TPA: redoxin domain-containing protein [Dehalococcoidia bacterium]|nr:redoxin domain-containing protein [Dehalococcoidia bacterium]
MPEVTAGDTVSDFTLPSTHGDVTLSSLLAGGRRLVLAFFHEAGTPSCETEVALLKDAYGTLAEMEASVLAVSADPPEAQRQFAEALGGLPFPLASDTELAVARQFGVVDEGDPRRTSRAIFVIDAEHTVLLALRPFQPSNLSQVEAMFAALENSAPS